MLIVGAGGHAKEILDIVFESYDEKNLCFFEEPGFSNRSKVLGIYDLHKHIKEIEIFFKHDRRYIIGVGNPEKRYELSNKIRNIGGILTSIISGDAKISKFGVFLDEGLNVMRDVRINPSTKIGEGTLLNARVQIHHDVVIGKYCEICPGAIITGKVRIGDFVSIGTGAILLPGIVIGNKAIIGAGAVVNKNVPKNMVVMGIPGKEKRIQN